MDSERIKWKTPSHYKPQTELPPRCPKCGVRGYIRSLESMGVKLKKFDEYKWKCTNCNKYFKEEPKDEPQTDNLKEVKALQEYLGIKSEPTLSEMVGDELPTDCSWKRGE